jgi:streptogramin lyase
MGLIVGPGGSNFWFTEFLNSSIGCMSTNGVLLAQIPTPTTNSGPAGITLGPDGNIWFTERDGCQIGTITNFSLVPGVLATNAGFREFPLVTNTFPTRIISGPDGHLWFTENVGSNVVSMTTNGVIVNTYPLSFNSQPFDLVVGPDGAIWFTEFLANFIGRIDPVTGATNEYPVPTLTAGPWGILSAPDGHIWFGEYLANQIGRITIGATNVTIDEFATPTQPSNPGMLAIGPDGNLWFTEYGSALLGELSLPTLGVTITNSSLVLSWPYLANSFTLESNTNLANTNGWTAVPIAPVLVGTNVLSVTIPGATNGNLFFRLFY